MNNVCLHESAHAVVALSYGARVSRLEVGRRALGDLAYGGLCVFHPGALPNDKQAEVYFAGAVSEVLLNRYWDPAEVKNDYERAAALLCGADPAPILERCRRRVSNLWPEIARLAETLLQLRIMDEGQIASAASMPPLAWTR
jgi:hypothetical protein